MKKSIILFGFLVSCLSCSEKEKSSELKSLVIEQMEFSHTDENWYVPINIALDDLTVEQSNWKDSTENHSIAELVSHLIFWNEGFLKELNGENTSDYDIANELTFKIYSEIEWKNAVAKLDSIQTELKQITEEASEEQLSDLASDVLTMTSHNAYHTGQIIYIRKRKGWWKRI